MIGTNNIKFIDLNCLCKNLVDDDRESPDVSEELTCLCNIIM